MKKFSLQQQSNIVQFGDYKSLKDFKKGKEVPKFKFTSDIVKEILDQRSPIYDSPNIPKEQDGHQKTWNMNMYPLVHPSSVKIIRGGIDQVRSQSYNLIQNIRAKNNEQLKAKVEGKEGPETDFNNQNRIERQIMEFNLSEAEQEKYLRIQKEYLEFFIEMGLPIPKDKQDLFKVIILKDYYSQDEEQKKRQNAIMKLENLGNTIKGKLKQIDRRQESKIISQANKNFNIYVHANRLKHEDLEYLKELNEQINMKIKYCTQPSLMQQMNKPKKQKELKDSQDNSMSFIEPQPQLRIQKNKNMNNIKKPKVDKDNQVRLPSLNQRMVNMKQNTEFESQGRSPQMTKSSSQKVIIPTTTKHQDQGGSSVQFFTNPQSFGHTQYSAFMHQTQSQEPMTIKNQQNQEEIIQKLNDEQKATVKEYFQKMYRKNKIKRSKAPNILFKPNLVNDQFEFFLKSLREKNAKEQQLAMSQSQPLIQTLGAALIQLTSQKSIMSPQMMSPGKNNYGTQIGSVNVTTEQALDSSPSPVKGRTAKLSEVFIEQNKFLPEKLFSIRKIKEYALGLPIEDENADEISLKREDSQFKLGPESMRAFYECQDQLLKMNNKLDEKQKDFIMKALRDQSVAEYTNY